MNKLKGSLLKFGYIEKLANGDSLIHRLNPLLKIILALMYIIFVISTSCLDFFELPLYSIIIGIMISLSKVSFMDLFKRSLIGLPISLCIGFSNLLFSTTIINFYGVNISTGVLLFITIIIKNILCLMAVFLLMATTKFDSITCELVHLKIPSIFVLQLVMIYRYIFVLVEEALTMIQAYQLKNPQSKGIAFKDMGSFVGSLLVRSFERSNEVYNAMKCRGFDVKQAYLNYVDFEIENYFLLMMAVGVLMIEINNLNVLYNNSIRALDNVSIKIEQQKCIAIVGENGSGKSTLLSSLLGLVETQGEIKINGVMLSKETLIQIREVAGLVFQNPDHMIFLPTVRDNLAFGLINQKLDKIEIDKRIAEFAKLFKIEDLLDRMANHLSGGQKRMVGLASVVVMKPEILLLDEPSAFLDPKSRRIVINMLKELPQQIIFATHDLDMVLDLCDEIILLNNGKIVSSGNPCEILANQELLEANGLELPQRYQR